jgi:cytochrome oxidase Cu insertion factor (SCO1/SenC/PrrC family)
MTEKRSLLAFVFSDKFQIVLLALIFLIPIGAAFFWKPTELVNQGELVQPARPVANIPMQALDGESVPFAQLATKWTMIYFGPADCPKACQTALYDMRQVRLAQGVNRERVQYVLVLVDGEPGAGLQTLRREHPQLRVMSATAQNLHALAEEFRLPEGSPLDGLGRVYLVDPLGNFMMSYPQGADPTGMNRDLARLLKASRIG